MKTEPQGSVFLLLRRSSAASAGGLSPRGNSTASSIEPLTNSYKIPGEQR
jgi:hypothetical protein